MRPILYADEIEQAQLEWVQRTGDGIPPPYLESLRIILPRRCSSVDPSCDGKGCSVCDEKAGCILICPNGGYRLNTLLRMLLDGMLTA